MNNNMRTKAAVKDNNTLIIGFKSHGYKVIRGTLRCDACAIELKHAAQTTGYTNDAPPWGNAICALMFKKDKQTIAACRCGWRKNITSKFTKVSKSKCKVRGCHSILGNDDTDGLCTKCRNEITNGNNPATYSAGCVLKPKRGCNTYIREGKAGCIRTKCNKFHGSTPPAISIKECNRNNCHNLVPAGRKAVCYDCQPPAREPVSSNFTM